MFFRRSMGRRMGRRTDTVIEYRCTQPHACSQYQTFCLLRCALHTGPPRLTSKNIRTKQNLMNHSTTNPKASLIYELGPGPDPYVRRVKEASGRGRSQIGVEKMLASAASHFCRLLDLDMAKCVILAVAALFSSGFRAILAGS